MQNEIETFYPRTRQETRDKRITEIVELADTQQKPKQFSRQKYSE